MKALLWQRYSSGYHMSSTFCHESLLACFRSAVWYLTEIPALTCNIFVLERAILINKWGKSCWLIYCITWPSLCCPGWVLVVTLVTEPGCPHSSKRPSPQKLLWKDLTGVASTEFSVPRITFRIGACFRVVLHHVWHCCRFIRQIAKNRKVLTSILIVKWVRRKCKFTVLNEKSGSKEELCEGFLLCCIVCCYIETIVLRYKLMGMLIANNRGEVSWFVSREIFPDT